LTFMAAIFKYSITEEGLVGGRRSESTAQREQVVSLSCCSIAGRHRSAPLYGQQTDVSREVHFRSAEDVDWLIDNC